MKHESFRWTLVFSVILSVSCTKEEEETQGATQAAQVDSDIPEDFNTALQNAVDYCAENPVFTQNYQGPIYTGYADGVTFPVEVLLSGTCEDLYEDAEITAQFGETAANNFRSEF